MKNIHPTAVVEKGAIVHPTAKVWHFCHVRDGAVLKENVSLGRDVFVDRGVTLESGTRVQNGVSIYSGVKTAPYCFIGPHVIFTNDSRPRVGVKEWHVEETKLEAGMSLGAGTIVVCGVTIGAFALVGAGTVVSKDIPPFHLVMGNPGRARSMVCACGRTNLKLGSSSKELIRACCKKNLDSPVLELAQKIAKTIGSRKAR